jgi:ankyrin repeat protein
LMMHVMLFLHLGYVDASQKSQPITKEAYLLAKIKQCDINNVYNFFESPQGRTVNINSQDAQGNTALHYAAQQITVNYYAFLNRSFECCATNLDCVKKGHAPLYQCSKCWSIATQGLLIQALLEKGANKNIMNRTGKKPQDYVVAPEIKDLFDCSKS